MLKTRQISINQDVLGATPVQDVLTAAQTIHTYLGKAALSIVPDQISSRSSIDFFLELSNLLITLSSCKGFKAHCDLYNSNVSSAVFTARVASIVFLYRL